MLKKYGKRMLLFLIFFIIMEVTFIANRLIDGKLNQQKNDLTLNRLKETVEESGAKERGLNEFQAIWEFEIKLVRDEFPKDVQLLFEYVDKNVWEEALNQLQDEVNTTYVTDEAILSKIIEIVPDNFEYDLKDKYLKSIKLLIPELFK